ncbi:hypothetical protein PLESTF_001431300 [Pleodorina starrii]|nr:hypothetical protein PLESTF_001431300 [Pleodorina starrii]
MSQKAALSPLREDLEIILSTRLVGSRLPGAIALASSIRKLVQHDTVLEHNGELIVKLMFDAARVLELRQRLFDGGRTAEMDDPGSKRMPELNDAFEIAHGLLCEFQSESCWGMTRRLAAPDIIRAKLQDARSELRDARIEFLECLVVNGLLGPDLKSGAVTQEPVLPPPVTQQPVPPPPVTHQPVPPPPVTQQPVLPPPVTQQPVLPPPVKKELVPQQPVTQQPVLPPPVTQQPVLPPPVKQELVPQQPVKQELVPPPPVTQQPVPPPPVTQQPVLPPPVTQQPVLPPPVTQQPVLPPPVTQQPVLPPPVTQQPVLQQPVMQQPVLQQPVKQELVPQQPVKQEPVPQQPVKQELVPQRSFPRSTSSRVAPLPGVPLPVEQQRPERITLQIDANSIWTFIRPIPQGNACLTKAQCREMEPKCMGVIMTRENAGYPCTNKASRVFLVQPQADAYGTPGGPWYVCACGNHARKDTGVFDKYSHFGLWSEVQ